MEQILLRIALCVGHVFAGNGFEFAADDVGGETRAEEAAVEGSELSIIDLLYCIGAAIGAQLAFDALPDDGGLVGVPGSFFEGGFDVAVRGAAGGEGPCHTKLGLLPPVRSVAGGKVVRCA